MNEVVLDFDRPRPAHRRGRQVSLGRHLIETGVIAPWQLFYAFDRQETCGATLTEILLSKGWVTQDGMLAALSAHYTAQIVDPLRAPPDPELSDLLRPEDCLRHDILPWQSVAGLLFVATGRPERFESLRRLFPDQLGNAIMVLCEEGSISAYLSRTHRSPLTRRAEARVPEHFSCRTWGLESLWLGLCVSLAAFVCTLALIWQPLWLIAGLTLWAVFSLIAVSVMKLFAIGFFLRHPPEENLPTPEPDLLPRISVMVPLFREKEIAHALIARLSRLTYPKALLDVLLVLEEEDQLTHETIARTTLPNWMRVVEVPAGSGLTTKPRALNYALDQCRGEIVGIWDAEDAPAPNQLDVVAAKFASSPPDVVCVQGILDYYNPWTNWLSRCFTLEYASWFRCILPGLVRMGFPIPLGGTTLFMRRDAIEELGGWDAHNVTEDADLGVRIARFGYRTEMIPSVTQEEANCRPVAWIKQRSRWLKGYMMTYLVHMRTPRQLYRDIGPLGFLGFQLVFLCTLSQFVLAPLIWAFLGGTLGFGYPGEPLISEATLSFVAKAFIAVSLLNIGISALSIRGQGRAALIPYVFTLPIYFTLGCLASYKALFELVFRPFYWDKTAHGKTHEGTSAQTSDVCFLLEPGDKSL
ncbi:glycosyltransferase family 2 protein [Shimia sediminis]|uniref:glycosyltransferase family 2 protein n=1 Tax=Shimia sediminis TaxID=2497945 RepID=UPI000F8D33D5|nr:glycosyltransferase family 2 protein [Shimia sediminis]